MIVDIAPVTRPWTADDGYRLDLPALTARYPVLAGFHRRLGGTPLVEVPSAPGSARIVAKAEWTNPCGSIKDRTAFALLCDLVDRHGDPRGMRVVEYSGGNLAAPLALLCPQLGIELTLVLSAATPPAYVRALRGRGAVVELVDAGRGFLGVLDHARDLAVRTRAVLLYQHRSQANVWFHRVSTGAEAVAQLGDADVARFVASVGTGGTLTGVLAALRERYPCAGGVVVSPSELPYGSDAPPNGLPKYAGSGGLGLGIRQPFVVDAGDRIVDRQTVSRPQAMAAMAGYRARTGVRIGSSAAANWLAAGRVAAGLGPERTVLTVFPDAGSPSEWAEIER